MSDLSIWPLYKTWLRTWRQSQRSDVSCSWPPGLHTSQEGFCPTPLLQILSKSLRFRGWCLATQTFSSLHRFSWRLWSGDWLGHCRTLMCFFLSHSFVALAMCFGSLSCWNTHPRPILDALASFNALALMVYMALYIVPLMRCSCPVPLAKKHPQSNVSMFDGVLGVIDSIPPPPNTASWVDAKALDCGPIWTQHLYPVLLWIIGKLQTACTCAFLSRGDLPGAAGFQSFTA